MVYDAAVKVIDGFQEGRSSIGHNSNVQMVSSSFSTPPPAMVSLMRSTSHSPSRNNASGSSKSSKKPVKRPAPYAKNKSVLARRKETTSSSMTKIPPSELWMAPIPTPTPQIMIQSPTNVVKKNPTHGQDPMPAILGLAAHQTWKPNVSAFIIKLRHKIFSTH